MKTGNPFKRCYIFYQFLACESLLKREWILHWRNALINSSGEYTSVYTKQAQKDATKISQAGLRKSVEKLLEILEKDPFHPPFEKLLGDLKGAYSRRITIQHRLVYQVYQQERIVKVIRMWTHYE
jgi:Txe/YoeB family toxin of toxin-antitoxin system